MKKKASVVSALLLGAMVFGQALTAQACEGKCGPDKSKPKPAEPAPAPAPENVDRDC